MKRLTLFTQALLAALAAAPPLLAQSYSIARHTIDGGGSTRVPALSVIALAFAFLMVSSLQPLRAATAEDFGFGVLKANGQPVSGSIPLLVIVYELSTPGTSPDGSIRQPLAPNVTTSLNNLIFNFFSFPSLNGYYLENSHSAFFWRNAGVLGPVTLNASETATLYASQSDDNGDGINETALDSAAGFNYLLGLVAAKTGYNFAQWDSNGDGSITQDELSIMVIGNNSHLDDPQNPSTSTSSSRYGANRPIGNTLVAVPVPGQNVTLRGKVASLDSRASFMTITHELSHSLGTSDLYGPADYSAGLTLMGSTIFSVDDDRRTVHFDPWHKMRFGWVRPRIFTLGTGGVATVAAAQFQSGNTPVILYDPARGTSEYFIVECRNSAPSGGGSYDTDLRYTPSSGLAVWHVIPGNDPPAFHEGAPDLSLGGNVLWNENQITPRLPWRDGSVSATQIHLLSVAPDGHEMTFEWITSSDTWVDFNYPGFPTFPENGTFGLPFNTMVEGVAFASHGGRLHLKSGTSSERPTIAKRLLLVAEGGPVTIGR
jgi:M6 family metalloprotease-like protein